MTPTYEVIDAAIVAAPVVERTEMKYVMGMKKPVKAPSNLVAKALWRQVQIDSLECDAGEEDSFFVCDLGEIKRAFNQWKAELPMVHPFYAVKCNPNFQVVKLLGQLGANFDCALKTEIDMVLLLGFDLLRVVYANPCKTNSFIRHLARVGVNLTTVDNVCELEKLAKGHPECGVLIRLATDDLAAQCRLLTKFGCTVAEAMNDILPTAKRLGVAVKGVAFHVGLGAKDFDLIRMAMADSRTVIDMARAMGFQVDTLDIGGGFERGSFAEAAKVVRLSLAHYFAGDDIRVIAEPGRFMVSNAFTLATHVIAKRDGENPMIYINDGVYGNMNCILFDHQHPEAKVLTHKGKFVYGVDSPLNYRCSLWGPTCDGLDCVDGDATLGFKVDVGDWLYFACLGAYTSAALTAFNGFSALSKVLFVDSEA